MAKEYKVGERYYLPVTVAHVYDNDHSYPIHIVFNNGVSAAENLITDDADVLLTAEEVAEKELGEPGKDYILLDKGDLLMMPSKNFVVSEEKAKIKTLTDKIASLRAQIATLTDERDGARKQADIFQEEIKKLTADCDKFAKTAKDKADLATKACDERNDAQGDLVTAREAIDYLQEENKKLKQEVAERDELLSDASDRIKTLEKAADRSIFFEKIANQQEVIDALVEKIQRLKGGD